MLPELGIEASEGQLQAGADRSFELHRRRIVPRDDVDPTLSALRDRGLSIGLLSNISSPGPDVFRSLSIAEHFRSVIFSSEVGFEKPAPTIYQKSIEQLGVPAESWLFVGAGGVANSPGRVEPE